MSLSFDDCLKAIGSSERRRVLAELAVRGPSDAVHVGPAELSTDSERRRDRLTMAHIHLPLLEDLDVVERTGDGFQVHRGDRFEDVRPLVELLIANREQWPNTLERAIRRNQ